MRHSRTILPALFCVVAVCPGVRGATFTAEERNVEALGEAGAFTVSEFTTEYGVAPSVLNYAGVFDSTSWSMVLSGSYGGRAVNLTFTATGTTPTLGTYVESGTVGTDAWSGTGTWSFADIDADTLGMLWTSHEDVTPIAGPGHHPDREIVTPKTWHDDGHGDRVDLGEYYHTVNGVRVGNAHVEHSIDDDEDEIPGRSGHRSFNINLPDDGVNVSLDSNFNVGAFSSSGTITVVPLPGAVSMGAVLFGIVLGARVMSRVGRR